MRKLLGYLRTFHKDYYRLPMYLSCLAFIGVLIAVNYTWDIEDSWIDSYRGKPIRALFFLLYHGLGYYGTLFILSRFGQPIPFRSARFWTLSLLGFAVLGMDRSWYSYYQWVQEVTPPEVFRYWYKIASNLQSLLTMLLPLAIIHRFWHRHQGNGLYGLHTHGVNVRPYVFMLLIMVPVVWAGSHLPGFTEYYPTYQRADGPAFAFFYQLPEWVACTLYETAYLSDFLTTELFFRGFLIFGFAQLLGKNVVWPMAATYAVLHFGKPLGETISSVAGGYILGILALYSRNIWGGVFIHGGVALLMEIFAFLRQ